MSQTPLGLQSIADEGLAKPDSSLGLIFGYLIDPWSDERGYLPDEVNSSSSAYWATYKETREAMRHLSRPYSTNWLDSFGTGSMDCTFFGQAELPLVIKSLDRPAPADCYGDIKELLRQRKS